MSRPFILDTLQRIQVEINPQDTVLVYHYQNDRANVPEYALFHAKGEISGSIRYHLDGSYACVSENGKPSLAYPMGAGYPDHRWCPDTMQSVFRTPDVPQMLCLKDRLRRIAAEVSPDNAVFVHIYPDLRARKPRYSIQYIPGKAGFDIGMVHYHADGTYALYVSPFQSKTYAPGMIGPDHGWNHHQTMQVRPLPVAKAPVKTIPIDLSRSRE